MSTDERIEALTQSVELLASMHRDLEQKWDQRMAKMLNILEALNDTTTRMARIIEIHEQRLDGQDDRLDNLEGH